MHTDTGTNAPTTALLTPIVEHAIELVSQWHDGTYRKGTWRPPAFRLPNKEAPRTPVIFHLTAVALAVQKAGWGPTTVAAAFLHDILEDQNRYGNRFTPLELEDAIGREVTEIVLQLTEKKEDSQGNLLSWFERKKEYIQAIHSFSPEAVAICLADKYHNLSSINESILRNIDVFQTNGNRKALNGGPHDQLWFFSQVLKATAVHSDKRLVILQHRLDAATTRFATLIAGK